MLRSVAGVWERVGPTAVSCSVILVDQHHGVVAGSPWRGGVCGHRSGAVTAALEDKGLGWEARMAI